ncbi:PKD domain-containing protein [Candidatus Bathyarchaeota archaeon]|nr:PKD domain-containing protein [Candidatus Bathyarchaeota archaeon]
MENQGVADICGGNSSSCSGVNGAPYLASLANNYALATQYVSLSHHSNPNYDALLGGSTFGCNNDPCPVSPAPNLVDSLESAGLIWKAYMEDQRPASGCDAVAHAPYTPQHDPFVGFADILNSSARCSNVVLANPSGCSITDCSLIDDLNSGSAPNFMWLTPNYCNDMHGFTYPNGTLLCPTSISHGDSYLSGLVPNILNSQTFTTQRSALFIVFDEGKSYCPQNDTSEDCVFAAWAGPTVKNNFISTNFYDHFSFTRTVEANWNLTSLTTNDASATPMSEFFTNNPRLPSPEETIGFSYTPTNPVVGQTVNFNASVSGGTGPYTYNWSFGDNSTGSGPKPTHDYQLAGPYDVTLTVTDSNNSVARTVRTIRISQPPLTVGISYSPSSPVEGQPVTLSASISGGMSPYSVTWFFGDGETSTSNPATHTYMGEGLFTVTVGVVDTNGANATSSKTLSVASSLTAGFTIIPSSPDAGQTTSFIGSASGGVSPYSYSWNFGDGSVATGKSSSHVFRTEGDYLVVLTVADAEGFAANASLTILVNPPLVASIAYTPSSPDAGQAVFFTGSSSGGNSPYSYSWSFGDGTAGAGPSPKHVFNTGGSYIVVLTVIDANKVTATTSRTIRVNPPLSASFSYNPSNPLPLLPVTFTATASGGSVPYSYSWSFGDGSTGSGSSVSHTYTLPGTYLVTLNVTDANGESFTISQRITVLANIPSL